MTCRDERVDSLLVALRGIGVVALAFAAIGAVVLWPIVVGKLLLSALLVLGCLALAAVAVAGAGFFAERLNKDPAAPMTIVTLVMTLSGSVSLMAVIGALWGLP